MSLRCPKCSGKLFLDGIDLDCINCGLVQYGHERRKAKVRYGKATGRHVRKIKKWSREE